MFNHLSIRYKLAILLGASATIALAVSLVAILYVTLQAEKEASLQNLHQVASIISENMQAAVAFHDSESADKILASLRPNTHILYALVQSDVYETVGEYRPSGKNGDSLNALGIKLEQLQQHLEAIWSSSADTIEKMSK